MAFLHLLALLVLALVICISWQYDIFNDFFRISQLILKIFLILRLQTKYLFFFNKSGHLNEFSISRQVGHGKLFDPKFHHNLHCNQVSLPKTSKFDNLLSRYFFCVSMFFDVYEYLLRLSNIRTRRSGTKIFKKQEIKSAEICVKIYGIRLTRSKKMILVEFMVKTGRFNLM